MNITLQLPKQYDKRIKVINQINWSLDPKLKYINNLYTYLILKEDKTWESTDDKNHKDILNSQIIYVRSDRKLSKKIVFILEKWSKKETGYLKSFSLNDGTIKWVAIPLCLKEKYDFFSNATYPHPNIGEFYRFCLKSGIPTTDLESLEKALDLHYKKIEESKESFKEKSEIEKILNKLIILREYYATTRRVGHTTLAMEGLKNVNARKKFLCEHRTTGEKFVRKNNVVNCKIVSWQNLNSLLDHYRDPLVIDNAAMYTILKDTINAIKNYQK